MLIDSHCHIFPPAIAERALTGLKTTMARHLQCDPREVPLYHDGTEEGLKSSMPQWETDHCVLLNIATKASQERSINDAALLNNSRKDNTTALGSVHPDSPEALSELERLKEGGVPGIKLHPDYQNFYIDDPKLYPVYDLCRSLDLTIVFHAGFDPLSPEICHCTPAGASRMRKNFPRLKTVLSHLGGMNRWDEVERELAPSPGLFLDTAMLYGNISSGQALRIIRRMGAERILFGSDAPWHSPVKERDFILSLGLSSREEELILGKNGSELFGI